MRLRKKQYSLFEVFEIFIKTVLYNDILEQFFVETKIIKNFILIKCIYLKPAALVV